MEKKDNVEKGVSGKPEEKKSAAYYEKRPEFGNRGPSKILLHFRTVSYTHLTLPTTSRV